MPPLSSVPWYNLNSSRSRPKLSLHQFSTQILRKTQARTFSSLPCPQLEVGKLAPLELDQRSPRGSTRRLNGRSQSPRGMGPTDRRDGPSEVRTAIWEGAHSLCICRLLYRSVVCGFGHEDFGRYRLTSGEFADVYLVSLRQKARGFGRQRHRYGHGYLRSYHVDSNLVVLAHMILFPTTSPHHEWDVRMHAMDACVKKAGARVKERANSR